MTENAGPSLAAHSAILDVLFDHRWLATRQDCACRWFSDRRAPWLGRFDAHPVHVSEAVVAALREEA